MRLQIVSTILLGIAIAGIASGQSSLRFTTAPIPLPASTEVSDKLWVADVMGSSADDFLLYLDGPYGGFLPRFGVADVDVMPSPLFASITMPLSESVEFVETGDVDGDGRVDAFVTRNVIGTGVFVDQRMNLGFVPIGGLPLQTTATFGPYTEGGRPRLCDLDGDGDLDLVLGPRYTLNSGNGTFGAPVTLNFVTTAGVFDVIPGDVDGDGDIDFIGLYVGNGSTGYGLIARILRRNASGTLTAMSTQLLGDSADAAHYTRATAGDVDGDGCMDLVAEEIFSVNLGSIGTNAVRIRTWKGGPGVLLTPQAPFTIYGAGRGSQDAELIDMNGDGILDYINVLGNSFPMMFDPSVNRGALVVLFGSATGEFVEPTGRGLTEPIPFKSASRHFFSSTTGTLGGSPDFVTLTKLSTSVRIINDSIGAGPVAATILESIGPDLLMTSNHREIRLRLVDIADQAVLRGHMISSTAVAADGTVFSAKFIVGHEAVLNFPSNFNLQSFPLTVSASDGYTQTFTVHPTASFVNPIGTNQVGAILAPFPQPIGATLVNASGTPLVGVRVELELPTGLSTSSPTFAYTDSQGRVAFSVTAGTSSGAFPVTLSAGTGFVQTTINVTVPSNSIVIDSGAGQTTCNGSPFPQPIVGHLEDQFGVPVSGETVEISSDAPSVAFVANTATTGIDGSFSFQALAVGFGSANLTIRRVGTTFASAPIPMTVTDVVVTITTGSGQIAYFGETFAEPLTVSVVDPCIGPVAGMPVAYSTSSTGLTLSSSTALTDAMGRAAITVTTAVEGATTVTATVGTWQGSFQLFTRRCRVIVSTNVASFVYRHEHPSVPLILAVEPPGAPAIPTPYGTIATSILAPSSTLAVLDGLGFTGPVDGLMVTGPGGTFLRNFAIPPGVAGTFLAQIYGYDLNAVFPFDYIVSNPVTFTF